MNWLRRTAIKLSHLFARTRLDRDFDDEMRAHVSLLTERFVQQGMTREEAVRAARRQFGNAAVLKDDRTDQTRFVSVEALWRDVRFGVRGLKRSPGFTVVATLLLALGIGANTAIFGVLDAVLLRPLPVRNPSELALVKIEISADAKFQGAARLGFVSLREFLGPDPGFPSSVYDALRKSSQVFSDVLAEAPPIGVDFDDRGAHAADDLAPVHAAFVSGNYFSVLGVDPAFGRVLTESDGRDESADSSVVVISYRFWKQRFGLDRTVVGRTVHVNGAVFVIGGVGWAGFDGTSVGSPVDLWLPLSSRKRVSPNAQTGLTVIGRLKPRLTLSLAQAGVRAVLPALQIGRAFEFPNADASWFDVVVADGRTGVSSLRGKYSDALAIGMGAVALVLLIACANLATLLLARASARQREIAVRLSLGATRARLVRQMFVEHLLLAALGGAAGLLVARWGTAIMVALLSGGSADALGGGQVDGRILAFTVVTTLLAALLFGLAPAVRATRLDANRALNEGSGSLASAARVSHTTRSLLIPVQVAASMVLLVCALLLVRTLRNLDALEIGFNRQHLLLVQFDLGSAGYRGARLAALADDLEQRVRSISGVVSTTVMTTAPFGGPLGGSRVQVPGYSPPSDAAYFTPSSLVGPDFFRTSGIRIVRGREFVPQDRDPESDSGDGATRPKVAIVNEMFVRRFLSGKEALGVQFTTGRMPVEIVGVAEDARYESLRDTPVPMVYLPAAQDLFHWRRLAILVRLNGPPADVGRVSSAIRVEVKQASGVVRIARIDTLRNLVDRSVLEERLAADVSGLAGALALLLVAVGLFGTLAYRVARRTRELGIRMALGAQRRTIFRMVLRETISLVAVGVAAGLPLALAAAQLISSKLFGVGAADWTIFGAATLLMTFVALIASCAPAYHATRVNPVIALRYD